MVCAGLLFAGCSSVSEADSQPLDKDEFEIHSCDMGFQGVPYLYELMELSIRIWP